MRNSVYLPGASVLSCSSSTELAARWLEISNIEFQEQPTACKDRPATSSGF